MTVEEAKNSTVEEIQSALLPKIKELKMLLVYGQDFESAGMVRDIEKKYLDKLSDE